MRQWHTCGYIMATLSGNHGKQARSAGLLSIINRSVPSPDPRRLSDRLQSSSSILEFVNL